MPDLPANTQYGSGPAAPPKKQFPKLSINPGGASRGISPAASAGVGAFGNINAPVKTALGDPNAAKITPVGGDYSSFKQFAEFPYEKNAGLINPMKPMIHQQPWENGGQYVFDPSNPSAMVKSNRELVTSETKKKILGALPPQLFQVDHIIPLWAGGADTPNNLQILGIADHEQKTKVQSVPLTLLAAGKINYNEARVMAQNWQHRDATAVPDLPAEGGNGLIDVKKAEEIYNQWKNFDKNGPAFFSKTTWKNFQESIPEEAQKFGKGWLPDFIREPLKGFTSGVTGGIIPYVADDDANIIEKGLGIVGVIAGSVLGIGKFAKVMSPVLAKTGLKVFQPTKVTMAGLGANLSRAAVAPVAKTSLIGATKAGGIRGLGGAVASNTKANLGSYLSYLRQNAAGNMARNAAIFVPYGLATEAGRAALTAEDEEVLKDMSQRFVFDVGLGGITGIASPGVKGALGVTFGTYVLDSALGTPWRDAMLNAAIMGGLHGVGTMNPRKLNTEQLHKSVEDEATGAMQNVLHWWVPEVPEVRPGAKSIFAAADDAKLGSAERIKTAEDWTDKAMNKLIGLRETISSDEYEQYRRQIITAGNYLRTTALPPAQREAKMLEDIASVFQKGKEHTFDINVPESVPNFLKAAGEDRLFQPIAREANIVDSPTTGEIRIAGTGIEGVNEQGMIRFNQAKNEGRASANLLVVNRPDSKALWELMSQNYTKDEIDNLLRKPFSQPQNAAQVFGVARGENGGVELMSLGWIPRKFTIDEKAYNFNTQPEIVNGTFPRNNPERNKDAIALRMNEENIPVVTMRLDKLEVPSAVKSKTRKKGQAGSYLIGRISEADWQTSKGFWDNFKAEGGKAEAPSPIAAAAQKTGVLAEEVGVMPVPDAAPVQGAIADGLDLAVQGKTAQEVLASPMEAGTSRVGQKEVATFLSSVDEAVQNAPSDKEVTTVMLQLGTTPEIAAKAAAGEVVSAKELLGSMRRENLIGQEVIQSTERMLGADKKNWFKPGSPEAKWGDLPVIETRAKAPVEEVAPVEPDVALSGKQELTPKPDAAPVEAPVQSEIPLAPPAPATAPAQPPPDIASAIVARATKGDIPITPKKREPAPGTVAASEAPAATEKKGLLDQDPIMKPREEWGEQSPEFWDTYNKITEEGLGTSGVDLGKGLDEHVDRIISIIKEAPVSDAERRILVDYATSTLTKDNLVLRGTSIGKSREAWDKQQSVGDVGEYIEKQKARIGNEFGLSPKERESRATKETPEAEEARIEKAIKEDAEPYLKMISEWKNLSPLSYQYGHNKVFDELAKTIWGKSYTKNFQLMRFFSDKDRLGRDLYHEGLRGPDGQPVRNKYGQEIGGLLQTEASNGKPISQPKDFIEASGVGDKAGAKAAVERRKTALEAARRRIAESQEEGGLIAKPVTESKSEIDQLQGGGTGVNEEDMLSMGRIEDPAQSASENIQDLTKYEATNLHGLLSGIEAGADPKLQAIRGAEDATTQIFKLVEAWNLAIKNNYLKGSQVRLKDGNLLKNLKEGLAKEVEAGAAKTASVSALRKELTELEKSTEALKEMSLPPQRRQELEIDKQIQENEARIAEIRAEIGQDATPVTDGAGGPGLTAGSPGVMFPSLMNQGVGIDGPPASVLGGRQEGAVPTNRPQDTLATRAQSALAAIPSKPLNLLAPTTIIKNAQGKIENSNSLINKATDQVTAAAKAAAEAPGRAFRGIQEGVADGIDYLAGNTPTVVNNGKDMISRILNGLAYVETRGAKDAYTKLGPMRKSDGARAYGKYQVMDFNIPSWTKQYLGKQLTPQQFLASAQAQEAVMRARVAELFGKYKNPYDVASIHFTGRPLAVAGNGVKDFTGTSNATYQQLFRQGMGV